MKPLHYVKKYNLKSGIEFNHKEFISDFTLDFLALVESHNGSYSLDSYQNVVESMRQKWDGIDNKTLGQLPEKLWNYFYATVVVPTKEELFKEQLEAIKAEKEARKKIREEYKERINQQERIFQQTIQEEIERRRKMFFENFFSNPFLSAIFLSQTAPVEELKKLGLTTEAKMEDIKSAYRELSKKHHPDVGGNQAKFIEITEAKNKCMAWAAKQ